MPQIVQTFFALVRGENGALYGCALLLLALPALAFLAALVLALCLPRVRRSSNAWFLFFADFCECAFAALFLLGEAGRGALLEDVYKRQGVYAALRERGDAPADLLFAERAPQDFIPNAADAVFHGRNAVYLSLIHILYAAGFPARGCSQYTIGGAFFQAERAHKGTRLRRFAAARLRGGVRRRAAARESGAVRRGAPYLLQQTAFLSRLSARRFRGTIGAAGAGCPFPRHFENRKR